ncbi:EAL domain-containing protein [Alteromonadales bacterium alter-6D02]|nr:EAL domain-containing protein [Alteromonadales bacterium alter-6D02]
MLSTVQLVHLIESKNFGVEYQPIIDVRNKEVFAYEALARFYNCSDKPIRPDHVFAALHDNPLSLYQVELAQKKLQLANAPHSHRLFVNLDQDSYFVCDRHDEPNAFLNLFKEYHTTLVVELIENSEISDARKSLEMINLMKENNIKTALDDVCNEHSMLSTLVLERVNYIKFDRYVMLNRHRPAFLTLLDALISYAKAANKPLILEGVETEEDFAFAQEIGVDYVQGFLFKSQFINIRA